MTSIDLTPEANVATFAQNGLPSRSTAISYTFPQQTPYAWEWLKSAELVAEPSREKICAIDCNPSSRNAFGAIDCIEFGAPSQDGLPQQHSTDLDLLVACAISEKTRRVYRDDLAAFEAWLGRSIKTAPATGHELAEFIAAMANQYKPATITRRLASISKAHRSLGLPSPTSSELVKATLRGMRRRLGTAQRQAEPLMKQDLIDMLERLPESLKGLRDRALLLVGFAGGFRRSELVALDVEDVAHVRQGMVITLRRSKTDQEGAGRRIGVPFARGRHCPVKAMEQWLQAGGIHAGAIFRSVNKHGQVDPKQRLSGEAVSLIVKEGVARIGQDPDRYSGHSLRAGLATSAAAAGIATWRIRRQTGHSSDSMLSRYIREGDLFSDNAAGIL